VVAIFTFLLLARAPAIAQEVLVVQSLKVGPYDDAVRGLKSTTTGNIYKLMVSELTRDEVVKTVRETRPDVIIAIGADALGKVRAIKDIPIVYLMVFNPQVIIREGNENITGISMNVAPEYQFSTMRKVMPDLKRLGILYDPAKSGQLVEMAREAAEGTGIELLAKEVRSPKNVPAALNSMKGKIGALWIQPDATVVTPETIECMLLFSLGNQIPIFAFSDQYVEMGAFISMDIDPYQSGKQAGELVNQLLAGAAVESIAGADARRALVTINLRVAKKLGIQVNDNVVTNFRVVR
jgi:putative ABC transport system substrate-binding protein